MADIVHALLDFTMPEDQDSIRIMEDITQALATLREDTQLVMPQCRIRPIPNPLVHGVRIDLKIEVPDSRQHEAEIYIDEVVTRLLNLAGIEVRDEDQISPAGSGSETARHVTSSVAEFAYA